MMSALKRSLLDGLSIGLRSSFAAVLVGVPYAMAQAPITAAPSDAVAAPVHLTLEDAQKTAFANNPDLASVGRTINISRARLREMRAGYLPQINGAITAVGAKATGYGDGKTGATALEPRLTAGNLNEGTVEDRAAAGIGVSELITDFGRTDALVESAKAGVRSAQDALEDQRQLLSTIVSEEFLRALEAQAMVGIARKTLDERSTLLDRVSLLQQNKLKSELDVNFASVDVGQAKLLLLQAQSNAQIAQSDLAATLGYQDEVVFDLAEPTTTETPPPSTVGPLLNQAMDNQPQLQRLREQLREAQKYASAQHRRQLPTVSLIGAAGVTPDGDPNLPRDYAAGGINLSIPIYQGGRLQAEYHEADEQARQAADALRSAQLKLGQNVRTSWLNAMSTFQAITVSDQLRDSARSALQLAQSRYQLGVSSIIELNRADLNALDAEIGDVRARYEYRIALARLAYQTGTQQTP